MGELQPLDKSITDEIREILEGCKSGKLKHDQEFYHCNTAHCIAGWKAIRDYVRATNDESILKKDFFADRDLDMFMHRKHDTMSEKEYAQTDWRLTEREANTLFDADATFPEQFALLEKLEAGERLV